MTDPLRALPNPVLEKITPDDFIKTAPKPIQLKSNPNGLLQQAARGFLTRLGLATLGLSLIKLFGEQSPYDSFLENPLIEKDNLSEEDVRKLLEELYNPNADQEMLEFLNQNYPELDFVTDENLLLALGWVEIQEDQNQDSVTAFNLLDLIFDKWDEEKRSELWEWLVVLHPELAEEIDHANGWEIFATPTPQTWSGDFEITEDWQYTDNPHYEDPFAVPDLSPKVCEENDNVGPAQNWDLAIQASGEQNAENVELDPIEVYGFDEELNLKLSQLLEEVRTLAPEDFAQGLELAELIPPYSLEDSIWLLGMTVSERLYANYVAHDYYVPEKDLVLTKMYEVLASLHMYNLDYFSAVLYLREVYASYKFLGDETNSQRVSRIIDDIDPNKKYTNQIEENAAAMHEKLEKTRAAISLANGELVEDRIDAAVDLLGLKPIDE